MILDGRKGRIEKNYPLQRLTTWRIGGPAEYVYWPERITDLVELYQEASAQGINVWLLGRGSNLLAPDEGLRGITVVTTELKDVFWGDGQTVRAGAGYSLAKLSQEAGERSLSGLEFARGIPGTLGGAVVMNAGAHGGEIGERVLAVTALVDGVLRSFRREELTFGYRASSLKGRGLVLEVELALAPGEREAIRQTMQENLRKRSASQPLDWPNAGSVFRNPPGEYAARLIEAAGWKGRKQGGAQVSEKHCNFIINTGGAKAQDVMFLIDSIRTDVRERFAADLQPEIHYLGRELEAEKR